MIDIIPTITENGSSLIGTGPQMFLTTWTLVYQLMIVWGIVCAFVGWGIGYHMYRLGIRFPWHKED